MGGFIMGENYYGISLDIDSRVIEEWKKEYEYMKEYGEG